MKLFATDLSATVREFYRANYPRVPIFEDVRMRPLPSHQLNLYMGGAPCTPFSPSGQRRGHDDPAGHLFYEQLRLIYSNRPLAVILENSDQLLSYDGGGFVRAICHKLREWGY